MATVEQTMMKVQRLLTGPMNLKVTLQGESFQVRFQNASTAININVKDWGMHDGEPETLVHLWATILHGVRPSPELFEWVARHGGQGWFGHIELIDEANNAGTLLLVMSHTLLGDFLDQRELEAAMIGVLGSADKLDDELQQQFGGKRWMDD